MKLNHMHLTVTDVSSAREFLETYFGLEVHRNPWKRTSCND